jgi:hypothetical protein
VTLPVIHFGELDELLAEVLPHQCLRVQTLELKKGTADQHGVYLAAIGTHVRVLTDETILCCHIRTGHTNKVGNMPLSSEEQYLALWDKAEAEAEAVRDHLRAQGLRVRPGIIDIGEARPVSGTWKNAPWLNEAHEPKDKETSPC